MVTAMKDRYNKNLGDFGENFAEQNLKNKGYNIITKNFYTRMGEIDIIATTNDNKILVFVEVKTRRSKKYGLASESINNSKIQNIVNTAKHYLYSTTSISEDSFDEIRFDVVEIYYDFSNPTNFDETEINHIINAFPDINDYLV